MNLKRHTADQLVRIAKDPMRACFLHQLMRDVEHVTLAQYNGDGYVRTADGARFNGWEGEVQS